MIITANTAKEMTIKAIEAIHEERNATVEFIIHEYIEPDIKACAEDGKYTARVTLHNIDRAWALRNFIEQALTDAGFRAQVIEENREIVIAWR